MGNSSFASSVADSARTSVFSRTPWGAGPSPSWCLAAPTAAEAALCYPHSVDYRPYITIEPGKRGGKPCIRGLRITVYDVLEYLASGMSIDDIVSDFPDLTSDDVRACLAFAADREKRLVKVPA